MSPRDCARLKLLGIFVIFFAPLALAYVLYYGAAYRGDRGSNHGRLVSPARPLPGLALSGKRARRVSSRDVLAAKWTLLEIAPAGCGPACRTGLDQTRQVRALLHDDSARVQRVLLVGLAQPRPRLPAQPDLRIYRGRLAPLTALFARVGADAPGIVYLVDPLGNWMLYYPSGSAGDGLFKDIKRLLKLSHIG